MERTEFLQKMHDLRVEQHLNKLNYTEKTGALKANHTMVIEEKTEKHKAEIKQLHDVLVCTLRSEKQIYDELQRDVENRMLEVKLAYFKDHELEKV